MPNEKNLLLNCLKCNKSFKTNKGLDNHICKAQLKEEMRESPEVQIAHQIYNHLNNREMSWEKFEKSTHYKSLIRFVATYVGRGWLFPLEYAKWALTNRIKIVYWLDEKNYKLFLNGYLYTEPARDALTRSVSTIIETGSFGEFFSGYSVGKTLALLESGKISPWIFLLYPNNHEFIGRLKGESLTQFEKLINMDIWTSRAARLPKVVNKLKEELKGVKI